MSEDTMLEGSPSSMLAKVSEGSAIAAWTDGKKQDFVDLFNRRSKAAQYILQRTATIITEKALQYHFIGARTYNELVQQDKTRNLFDRGSTGHRSYEHVGGRPVTDLNRIARERAELILDELPPIKKAVQIIDPDTAGKMDERDRLIGKLKVLKRKLEDMPITIVLAEVDQAMSIGAFRKEVKALEKQRKGLVTQMCDIGGKGQELDSLINKKLYKGLPGLSDAVKKVALQHIERATALDSTTRRVEEKVKFGDDTGAVELLRGFERDEVTVSDSIQAEFKHALGTLKLEGSKRKKKAGKTKGRGK